MLAIILLLPTLTTELNVTPSLPACTLALVSRPSITGSAPSASGPFPAPPPREQTHYCTLLHTNFSPRRLFLNSFLLVLNLSPCTFTLTLKAGLRRLGYASDDSERSVAEFESPLCLVLINARRERSKPRYHAPAPLRLRTLERAREHRDAEIWRACVCGIALAQRQFFLALCWAIVFEGCGRGQCPPPSTFPIGSGVFGCASAH